MRYRAPMLLLLALVASACTAAPGPLTGDEEMAVIEEVMEALNGLTGAMNAHDREEIFSFYRQDDSFLYLGCTDILFGWGPFSTRVGPYYDFHQDITFEREVISIQALSANAAVAALRGGSNEAEFLFWTQVLQKSEDGRWLITHEHESWPDCPAPRGPHMGTEEMGEMEMAPIDPGVQGLP